MNPHPTILVADDDARVRTGLADILSGEGYAVRQASNGEEALAEIRQGGIDVVLLDLHMPVMDGMEVIRAVKADPALSYIPIVIVTGSADIEARIEALGLGADDYLFKPPHVAEISARVRSLVQVKAYHDHLLNYQKELEERVQQRTMDLTGALKELSAANDRLKRNSLNTIYCLSRAGEYKDEDTAAHVKRIGRYTRVLGRCLGFSEEEQEALLYATPMHDIGKIGIPDRVLLKPGKLDADEWELMKQHTVFGGRILSGIDDGFLEVARVIALSHHERWDGSGYPQGLSGKDIPRAARITAVADVFDALSSNRPYKHALSLERSAEIIVESSGSHFDPEIVRAFSRCQDEMFAIRRGSEDAGESLLVKLTAIGENETHVSEG
jgi:putative two-component system response regulator